MRVLVTGGAGLVGKSVTARLVQHGCEVRVVGIVADVQIAGAEYAVCDITDYDRLREQMHGFEAVVHLAAIPSPRSHIGPEVFRVNVAGTFNVFEAAAASGIHRVVQASSINAMGCAWNLGDMTPEYLPIDEAHPVHTTDPYSFSKQMVEEIGDYYWRREGISSAALRFPAVWTAERLGSDQLRQRIESTRASLDEFMALSEAERSARLEPIRQDVLEHRRERPLEFSMAQAESDPKAIREDWLWRAYMFDRFNFWAYIDERDSAQSVEKALTADYEGSHALLVNNDHNWLEYDARTLATLFFPEVRRWTRPLHGTESLVSIDRARELIGFEPEYPIRSSP